MRIGILTFHSEINYGSVLQALALQTHLISLGYDVVVIDKWEDADNRRLLGPLATCSVKEFLRFCICAVLQMGSVARLSRCIKTIIFLRRYLKRTKYHFYKWAQAPRRLGLDMIVIGSDQVWNPRIVAPSDYLMESVPGNIPGIAYAASFGQHELLLEWRDAYVAGFRRLKAISCRESEGVRLVDETGVKAEHVADPTILVDPQLCWHRFIEKKKNGQSLVVYNMNSDQKEVLLKLKEFATQNRIDVFYFSQTLPFGPIPKSIKSLVQYVRFRSALRSRYLHLMISASPAQWVRAFAGANYVLTNSFHGLMFSTIFRKNVRVVLSESTLLDDPSTARILEFAGAMIKGDVVCSSLEEALKSLVNEEQPEYDNEAISAFRSRSERWLRNALVV